MNHQHGCTYPINILLTRKLFFVFLGPFACHCWNISKIDCHVGPLPIFCLVVCVDHIQILRTVIQLYLLLLLIKSFHAFSLTFCYLNQPGLCTVSLIRSFSCRRYRAVQFEVTDQTIVLPTNESIAIDCKKSNWFWESGLIPCGFQARTRAILIDMNCRFSFGFAGLRIPFEFYWMFEAVPFFKHCFVRV